MSDSSAKDKTKPETDGKNLSRRNFLKGVGLVGAGGGLVTDLLAPETPANAEPLAHALAPQGETLKRGIQSVTLQVNGKPVTVQVEPRTTLLNALRNHADPPITGPKLVCDVGACGACTVILDGKTACSCLLLAGDVAGKSITTVEGLTAADGSLSPVQEAFVAHDAMMCGFCTPGFVVSVSALLKSNPNPTLDEVKHACAGNTCRCGTYPRIFEAALDAAKKTQGGA